MCSFAHPEQVPLLAEVSTSFVLDNGAFSFWKKGAEVDFTGYAAWIESWYRHPGFDWCLIPDKIDGDEIENDSLLATWDFPSSFSVPVWHLHESLERLERLVTNYPRIALGSSGEYRTPNSAIWWRRMEEARSILVDSQNCMRVKVHGLRMMNPTIFSHIPFSSVDSTSVAINIGIDKRWIGPYEPVTKLARALVLVDRFEGHASATSWLAKSNSTQRNEALVG